MKELDDKNLRKGPGLDTKPAHLQFYYDVMIKILFCSYVFVA